MAAMGREQLAEYRSILQGSKPARHRVCRGIEVDAAFLEKREEEALWKAHERGMRRFREAWELNETPPAVSPSLLDLKLALAELMLESCRFCERRCGADRTRGERGFCGVGGESRFASQFLHMGEEPELVPSHTVFFSGCTFSCAYCQNWDIAMHPDSGSRADPRLLARVLEEGMQHGSRNANFVGGNPDPHLHTILATVRALGEAADHLPLVWNSNMFTSEEAMRLLEGVMDIWLADFRYGNDDCARRLSDVEGYTRVVTRNLLRAAESGEVMLRHLLLPGHRDCCTEPIMRWVSENLPGVYYNLMFQYRPEYRASLHPGMDRRLSPEERREALELARRYRLDFTS